MEIKEYEKTVIQNDNSVSMAEFWQTCKRKWKWFVCSVIGCCLLGLLFILVVNPKYERNASVLIKDESSSGGMLSSLVSNMGMLSSMAGINISSNVNNEMEIFKSPALMEEVVNRLELDIIYQTYKGIRKIELYDEALPIKVTFPKMTDKDGAYMKMDLKKDGTFTLYKFRLNKDKFDGEVSGKVNSVCQTPIGPVSVIATKFFDNCLKEDGEKTIRITKKRKYDAVESCMQNIQIDVADDLTDIIGISYQDISGDRAEKIINTLIQVYREEWTKEKKGTADASTHFINERIKDIELELANLDKEIAQFKGKHLIPDYEQTAKMYMENAALTYEAQTKINNQLYMMEHMRKQVQEVGNTNQVLPANLLPDNENVATQILEYNKLQLQRNRLSENSSSSNPLVIDLDNQLAEMRKAIVNSLDQSVAQLKASQRGINKEDSKLKQEIAIAPEKITQILPAERQQKIIEALYIYLLEKREENNITQVFSSRNTRVIAPPMGKLDPVFPKKFFTLLIALLVGIILPASAIFVKLNTRGTKAA
jgi:uncharacterized protein involved in exopolysaccharide biosynthesis